MRQSERPKRSFYLQAGFEIEGMREGEKEQRGSVKVKVKVKEEEAILF